ncbi:MAG: diaminopropionate ammonia-lyase [Fusobacteria bacterium]|nr:diaminopropionate ammonia-lyase [Fusobacteriota bacterium]
MAIKWLKNSMKNEVSSALEYFTIEEAEKALKFHKSIYRYSVTPLHSLASLSEHFNVKNIYLKDESIRFEEESFKSLGRTYAMGKILSERIGKDISDVSFGYFYIPEVKAITQEITFATATDGGFGVPVSWAAKEIGHKAMVYATSNVSRYQIEMIQKEGAEVKVFDKPYSEVIVELLKDAQKNAWEVVQDTTWKTGKNIPVWIMQGYMTLMLEVKETFEKIGESAPTHIFVQAGLGSLAASVIGLIKNSLPKNMPKIILVENENDSSIYYSAQKADGTPHSEFEGTESLELKALGLSHGAINEVAWDVIKSHADYFFRCSKEVHARGMRILASVKESPITSGASGGLTMGLLSLLLENDKYCDIKSELELGLESRILLINTEGLSDPKYFREVVWDGKHSSLEEHCK